ncbi:MAG: sterol desaturase family protein [Ostreibacterium sp.]
MDTFLQSSVTIFLNPSKRFFIGYLMSAGMIAVLHFWLTRQKLSLSHAKHYWLHPSAKLDYAYFFLSILIKVYVLIPLIFSAKSMMLWVSSGLISVFGYAGFLNINRATVMVIYTVTLFVVSDFSRYWLHRAMHAIPALWVFHKVHHSAEVLNPATFYRSHPVENLLFGLRYSLVVGGLTGVFIYYFGAKVQLVDILGANALLFSFNFISGNLRHSHIGLRYPAVFERFFISPRQHQIHHSYHFTRFNYGGYLACWDSLFGTLKTSQEATLSPYGLGKGQSVYYDSVRALLTRPFIELLKKR